MDDISYDVSVSQDSICYANGPIASLYGKGGIQNSWQDQPSFSVLSSLISTLPESKLLPTISLIVGAHPAVVNGGHSHFGWRASFSLFTGLTRTRVRSTPLRPICPLRCYTSLCASATFPR